MTEEFGHYRLTYIPHPPPHHSGTIPRSPPLLLPFLPSLSPHSARSARTQSTCTSRGLLSCGGICRRAFAVSAGTSGAYRTTGEPGIKRARCTLSVIGAGRSHVRLCALLCREELLRVCTELSSGVETVCVEVHRDECRRHALTARLTRQLSELWLSNAANADKRQTTEGVRAPPLTAPTHCLQAPPQACAERVLSAARCQKRWR